MSDSLKHPRIRRQDRSHERGRRVAQQVSANGGSALQAALAWIDTTFDGSGVHNDLKCRVEAVLCRGPSHPSARARYGDHALAAAKMGADLDTTIDAVRTALITAHSPWAKMVLTELALILRWLRRHAADRFPDILSDLVSPPVQPSAPRTILVMVGGLDGAQGASR